MSTKKNKSFLLLIINIILITLFVNFTRVTALDYSYEYKDQDKMDVINKIDLLGPQSTYVDYEITEGLTVKMTTQEAKKIEDFKQEQLERKLEEERLAAIRAMKTVETSRVTSVEDINVYTDLSVMNTVDADQMNIIIDYWDSITKNGTAFKGLGQTFIDAAKQSGLDPIYILAHAGLESSWGNKNMSHNYFGIGAYDYDPGNGHNYSNNSTEEGIINGANWISRNYYNQGQTSLYSMRYNNGNHEYCTSETWMHDIANIMTTSYSIIK